jgi:hypothetical protein
MGLNHMNGRVEDAILGRFLSPDPKSGDASDPQSYNGYSYVQNRPLTLADPTGMTAIHIKPGMPCIDNCRVPANIGRWRPSLVRSVYGGLSAGTSGVGAGGNTGDGGLAGLQATDATLDSLSLYSDQGSYSGVVAFTGNSPTGDASGGAAGDATSSGGDSGGQAQSQNTSNSSGGALAYVGPLAGAAATESGASIWSILAAIAAPIAEVGAGVLLPNSTASDDTTATDSIDQYVFHFANDAKMQQVLVSGAITPSSQGVVWVSPTPYATASAAQSNLALPNTPTGYFIVPVQNVQTPLSWSTVLPNFGQPGGGVEGTTPLAIPITGPGGTAVWVPFH